MIKYFTMNEIDQLVPYALIWKDLRQTVHVKKQNMVKPCLCNKPAEGPRKPFVRYRFAWETSCALQPCPTLPPGSGGWPAQTESLAFLPLGFPWVQSMVSLCKRLEGAYCSQSLLYIVCCKILLQHPTTKSVNSTLKAHLCFPQTLPIHCTQPFY